MFLAHEQDVTERYFFLKVKMVQTKMNSISIYLFYSLISLSNIKDKNKIINNYRAPHNHISHRKMES